MKKLILYTLILFNASTIHSSVFDVLNEPDRYKTDHNTEFDIDEGNTKDSQELDLTDIINTTNSGTEIPIQQTSGKYHNTADIIVLNKVTAKSKKLSIKVGSSAYFGNIEIAIKKCWSNEDLYRPDNQILITVMESKIDEDQHNIFTGWILSSNIASSIIEHPVYEIIAIKCYEK
jgi:hypothetical protein